MQGPVLVQQIGGRSWNSLRIVDRSAGSRAGRALPVAQTSGTGGALAAAVAGRDDGRQGGVLGRLRGS